MDKLGVFCPSCGTYVRFKEIFIRNLIFSKFPKIHCSTCCLDFFVGPKIFSRAIYAVFVETLIPVVLTVGITDYSDIYIHFNGVLTYMAFFAVVSVTLSTMMQAAGEVSLILFGVRQK